MWLHQSFNQLMGYCADISYVTTHGYTFITAVILTAMHLLIQHAELFIVIMGSIDYKQ